MSSGEIFILDNKIKVSWTESGNLKIQTFGETHDGRFDWITVLHSGDIKQFKRLISDLQKVVNLIEG